MSSKSISKQSLLHDFLELCVTSWRDNPRRVNSSKKSTIYLLKVLFQVIGGFQVKSIASSQKIFCQKGIFFFITYCLH